MRIDNTIIRKDSDTSNSIQGKINYKVLGSKHDSLLNELLERINKNEKAGC
jgi:hypothetical protein